MIVSILNRASPLVWGTFVLFGLLLSGCAGRLPPEERARLRAEQERAQMERALSTIHPIGKEEHRRLSKEEAFSACNQKAEGAAKAASQKVKLKQSIEASKTKGGEFSGGAFGALADVFEQKDAANLARNTTMSSCLIDYGYIMR